MALAIGVHPKDKIYVNDTPVEVVHLHGYDFALLRINGAVVKVDDQKTTEILPSVFVACGKPSAARINKHAELVIRAHEEWDRRSSMSGGANLPKVELPSELLPRLLFEAPKEITILREELYLKNVRKQAKTE